MEEHQIYGLQSDAFIVKKAKNKPSKKNSLIKQEEETMSGQQETAAQADANTSETRGVHLRAFSRSFSFYFKSVNKPERRVNIRIQGVRGRRRKHESHFHGINLSFLISFLRFLLSSFGALMFKDTLFSRL